MLCLFARTLRGLQVMKRPNAAFDLSRGHPMIQLGAHLTSQLSAFSTCQNFQMTYFGQVTYHGRIYGAHTMYVCISTRTLLRPHLIVLVYPQRKN
jgi:hypothetical protein